MSGRSNRRLAAILFTDIVGYTAMMQRDEADGLARLRRYRQVLEKLTGAHGGEIIQHYGDGSLCIFDSAVEALHCARSLQQELREPPVVWLRTGIHVGDVVRDGEHIFGDGVNLASRVESLAEPGSVLFTERVHYDIRNHPGFRSVSLGRFNLKNVEEPVEVFALADEWLTIPDRKRISRAEGAKVVASRPMVRKRQQLLLAALVLAAVIIAGAFLWPVLMPKEKPPVTAVATTPRSNAIAVLPFNDLSPSGDQAYFGDGIAEEILNALAQIEGLQVSGRTSSFSFRGKKVDLREIGTQLGVGNVLEGSVRKAGDRVRVTAHLVNAADGYELWSHQYDGQMDDIFAIQEQIAQAVVQNLRGILLPERPASIVKTATQNQEAYEWYLRGRHMLRQRTDGAGKAAEFFRKAIELDPGFAMAYAGLAHACLWLGWGYYLPSHEAFPQARQYALEALRIDSTLAYAHSLTGSIQLWYDWQWEEARQALEKAVAINPSEGQAYLDLAWYYTIAGRFEQAFAEVNKALALDPLNLDYNIDQADFYRMARRYDQALDQAEKIQELYPANSDTYWILGMIHYNRGNFAQALHFFELTVQHSNGEPWARIHLVMGLAKTGKTEEAATLLDQLERQPEQSATTPVELAMAHLCLGHTEASLDLLEKAFQLHSNWLISLKVDPIWDPLRGEPRFQALLSRMKMK